MKIVQFGVKVQGMACMAQILEREIEREDRCPLWPPTVLNVHRRENPRVDVLVGAPGVTYAGYITGWTASIYPL